MRTLACTAIGPRFRGKLILILITIGALGLAVPGWLAHWQQAVSTPLEGVRAAVDKWECDGKAQIRIRRRLLAQVDPARVPHRVVLDVRLDARLQNAWEIWRIDLLEVSRDGDEVIVESVQCVHNPCSRFHAREHLTGFRSGGHSYDVIVFLHAFVDVSEEQTQAARRAVTDGSGVSIRDVFVVSQATPSVASCSQAHCSSWR